MPRSRGGSDRVSNLTLACGHCNGAMPVENFLAGDSPRLARIRTQLKRPLAGAAIMNAMRYALKRTLEATGLPVSTFHRRSHQIQPYQARPAQDPCPRRRQLRQRRCNQPPANPRRPVRVPDLDPDDIEDNARLPHRRPGQGHRAEGQKGRHLDRPRGDPRQRNLQHQGPHRTTGRPGHLPPPLPRPAASGRLRLRRAITSEKPDRFQPPLPRRHYPSLP